MPECCALKRKQNSENRSNMKLSIIDNVEARQVTKSHEKYVKGNFGNTMQTLPRIRMM